MQTGAHILVLSAHDSHLDRRIVAEANALAASGRHVTLLSVPTGLAPEGLDGRIRLIVAKSDQSECVSPAKRAARRLPAPLRTLAQAAWYRWGAGPSPYNTGYFRRNAPAERFDAIHCHDLKTLPAGSEIRAASCRAAKLIYDSHELFPFQSASRAFQRYWMRIERRHIAQADLVITVNESIASELARLYGVTKPHVLYNSYGAGGAWEAVAEEAFLRHFHAQGREPRILFQGGLAAGRNLANLVRAFGRLEGRARLFLLGAGPKEAALRRICGRARIGAVHFGPWVEQSRLLSFVAAAHLGVIPYLGDRILNNRYCTPNKLFEFIEAGVPVCGSDLPELRRIIRGFGVGEVYPMRTPDQIAAALSDCLSRRESGKFTKEASGAARAELSWSKQAERFLRWYGQLGV